MTSTITPINVKRLQHVVLQVTDVERSVKFYSDVLGLVLTRTRPNGAAFLHIPDSGNDHDFAIFPGATSPAPKGSAGLVHVAWEVATIEELARAREVLVSYGALDSETNHGMNLSVYGRDPDGLQFEVFWFTDEPVGENVPLELDRELAKRS
jgi:catechol 2,3-dioxygenase-like lactoylglutathione lyase family enzyme